MASRKRLPPRRNHSITAAQAREYTERHQAHAAVKAHGFDAAQVRKLLDQSDCVALRIYYGQDKDGAPVLVLAGVDSKGNDITGRGSVLLENPWFCPPFCP